MKSNTNPNGTIAATMQTIIKICLCGGLHLNNCIFLGKEITHISKANVEKDNRKLIRVTQRLTGFHEAIISLIFIVFHFCKTNFLLFKKFDQIIKFEYSEFIKAELSSEAPYIIKYILRSE